jgi:hypothetical protein
VLNLATVCDDGPFPWASDASIPVRQQQLAAAIAGLPPGATGPFGSWAVALGSASTCLNWPSPSGGRTLAPGPLPDVPALVLSGGQDMRTPREGAVAEAARFPQGHLLVAPGVGHGVTGSSVCVDDALRAWVGGATPPAACPRVAPIVAPLGPFRRSLADEPPTRPGGRAGSTLAAVVATLQEARAAWLFTGDAGATLTGLEGGTLKPGKNDSFRLKGYSDVRGVELNGVVTFGYDGPTPSSLVGVIDVSGTGAHGSVSVRRSRLTGKLDGRAVSLRLRG